jgi:hypothetical protein
VVIALLLVFVLNFDYPGPYNPGRILPFDFNLISPFFTFSRTPEEAQERLTCFMRPDFEALLASGVIRVSLPVDLRGHSPAFPARRPKTKISRVELPITVPAVHSLHLPPRKDREYCGCLANQIPSFW